MFWWVVFFAALGLLMVILAIPMILGKVPPNSVYGFRTKQTMSDPEIWYPANTYAGNWLLACGVMMMVAALLHPWLLPDLTEVGVLIDYAQNPTPNMSPFLLDHTLVLILRARFGAMYRNILQYTPVG